MGWKMLLSRLQACGSMGLRSLMMPHAHPWRSKPRVGSKMSSLRTQGIKTIVLVKHDVEIKAM